MCVVVWSPAVTEARLRPADLRPAAPRLLAPRTPPAVVVVDVVRNAGGGRPRGSRAGVFPPPRPAVVVVDVVRNAGGRRSRASRTRFFAEQRTAGGAAGRVVVGSRSVPALRPGGVSRRTVTLRLPATLAPGAWSVVACVGDDCRT